MRLTVIGCSGSGPGRDGAASCYLVEAGDARLVLDVGPGALAELGRHVRLPAVDAVLLSHLHPDHCLDLCAWHVAARYGDAARPAPLPVVAPSGAADRLARAYGVLGPEPLDTLAFSTWEPEGEIAGVRVTSVRAEHPGESYAMRLEHGGRSLVFTGDTGPSTAVTGLATGADLLLAEAAVTVPAPGVHLTGADAGAMAGAAGVGRLVLTHIPSWTDPAAALAGAEAAFAVPVDRASVGAVHEV